jgi:hypothetical protein
VALKPLKAPKVPAWKKPLKYVQPKLPKAGHYGPSIYNPSGRNMAWKPPTPQGQQQPQYKMFDWNTVAGAGDFSGNAAAFQQPDYGAMISGDWEVQDAEAAMGAQMARARGDFQAQLRSQLIDLGLSDTSKLGSLGQYIDADTITKAAENKYSATAQIGQQAERARAGNNAALAARGLLSSGQTTKTQQDVSSAAESGRYSALRSFLEGGASGLSGLADMEYNLARNVAAARQAAAMRAADLYQLGGDDGLGAAPAAAGAGAYDYTGYKAPRSGGTPGMLTKKQFMQRRPQGRYQNYLQAFRRHARTGY